MAKNNYLEYELPVTPNQISKIKRAAEKKQGIKLKFTRDVLKQKDNLTKLLLTKTQVNRIEKHRNKNTGVEINFSQSQLKKNQVGGFLPILPVLAKVVAPIAMSAVSGLVGSLANSLGNKITGNGVNGETLVLHVPRDDLSKLISMVKLLETKNVLPGGSSAAVAKDVELKGGAFVLPLVESLLGTFLPSLFKGSGVYLPWEKN